jgi:hypothetical protein
MSGLLLGIVFVDILYLLVTFVKDIYFCGSDSLLPVLHLGVCEYSVPARQAVGRCGVVCSISSRSVQLPVISASRMCYLTGHCEKCLCILVLYLLHDVRLENSKGKGKVVPLRSTEAHLGERRYSSYSFLTTAL